MLLPLVKTPTKMYVCTIHWNNSCLPSIETIAGYRPLKQHCCVAIVCARWWVAPCGPEGGHAPFRSTKRNTGCRSFSLRLDASCSCDPARVFDTGSSAGSSAGPVVVDPFLNFAGNFAGWGEVWNHEGQDGSNETFHSQRHIFTVVDWLIGYSFVRFPSSKATIQPMFGFGHFASEETKNG